eukprot:TRINITY_DN2063_c1_g1_i1.p1 TRINITY_DN2063_c1_g1~~TRINITY_DN2063_c1_g1_i1.p1  ORF type:complete len:1199 (-),score=341.41 TRINITY_DN2063_c1_g1_i1:112-3708(-)
MLRVNLCQAGINRVESHIAISPPKNQPFQRLLVANRAEIAVRIFRAATSLGVTTLAVYSHEDRLSIHRYTADESYLVGQGCSPVQAYLDVQGMIDMAIAENVDAIHPGYGFLSERADFAKTCEDNNITFIGPPSNVIDMFGDKTSARKVAIACGVPVVPGSDGPIANVQAALDFVDSFGLPVMLKAAMGGGGRGMRIVRERDRVAENFMRASSEAKVAFGDGTMFIEKLVERPRHIEIQILGDTHGNVVHLFERDCSLQRRHQKVCEIAPASHVDPAIRAAIAADAVKLCKYAKYVNAGTVEFLLDQDGKHFFIEVNPRIQVEHTITEEITGIDLVQAQICIAAGATLEELGISQDTIKVRGHAIQCRVTTEDPEHNFQPDTGRITVYRSPGGHGIRLDGGMGYAGSVISPHYDSLLVKLTGRGPTYKQTIRRLLQALGEMRVRGVKTNIKFLVKVLSHPDFVAGEVYTDFIETHPNLFDFSVTKDRDMHELLPFFGELIVNGCSVPGAADVPIPAIDGTAPDLFRKIPAPDSFRKIYLEEGPAALAKAIRARKGALITDTTWRDAHQSLLATRVRTVDMLKVAHDTAHIMAPAFSLEMWGGATFDVCLRFLKECPWKRLHDLRKKCPNMLFQMLLRGANAVGYTAYPDNVVFEFVRVAKEKGIDVFRIFDCLNYFENMKLGIDAVQAAGGIVEASICYTGDLSSKNEKKYTLEYYLGFARQLVEYGVHILAVKDMAGLLKPEAATILISALRKEFPDTPIHVHTHDTAGTGVASMIACVKAGADIVDGAIDSLSGMTSQPSLGAIVNALSGTEYDTGLNPRHLGLLSQYWEDTRALYAPFESGIKSGSSDVYQHEMPGGQYTNLQFQSHALGLKGQWAAIKAAYCEANELCGNIVKVTPSSKVVGDLAQFMVANSLNKESVLAQAGGLSFPTSVIEFFQGYLGVPYQGFPEPLASMITRGKGTVDGRPGASLEPLHFDELRTKLEKKYGDCITEVDVLSAALYPKVFDDFMDYQTTFGDVSAVPTRYFLKRLSCDDEIAIEVKKGCTIYIKHTAVGPTTNGKRTVFFEVNGNPQAIEIPDRAFSSEVKTREKANKDDLGSIGAPMGGVVVDIRAKVGQIVKPDDPLVVLSAMKMETIVSSPVAGIVKSVNIINGDSLMQGDLLCTITERGSDPHLRVAHMPSEASLLMDKSAFGVGF